MAPFPPLVAAVLLLPLGETGLFLFLLVPPARMAGGASKPLANLSLSLSLVFLIVEGPASPLDVARTVVGRRNEEGSTRFDEMGCCSSSLERLYEEMGLGANAR